MSIYDYNSLNLIFSQVVKQHFNRAYMLLQDLNIYPGQAPLLFILRENAGLNQKQLAKKLLIKPATITVMLNRMEKANLVERRQDEKDQRISRVYLTEKGRQVCNEAFKKLEIMEKECFGNFTAEDRATFRRLLIKMYENLSKTCNEDLS